MQPDSHWRTLYPFRSQYVSIEPGVRMHFLDEYAGEQPPSQALVMVHGNPTWSFYWRNLVTAFRDRYRIVVPDHVGCGLSDKPQEYPYTLQRRIADLVQLIDHLDLRDVTMVVHDWGGAIGLGAALQRPDRVRRLVLFNTGAFPPPFIPFRIRLCLTPWIGNWAMRQLNLFARAALSMAVEKRDRMTPVVRAGLLAPYDNWEHRVAIARFVQDIPRSPAHPTWGTLEQIENGLSALQKCAVQMIWGMQDWCFDPRCLERLEGHFPDAEVHRLADAGHYVVEDAHEQIVNLMSRFLLATERSEGRSSQATRDTQLSPQPEADATEQQP